MKFAKPPAYIRFLNALDTLDRLKPGKQLDGIEEQLLDYITLHSEQNKALLVGDLINLSQFGSQATLHGRLKNLVVMDYVRLVVDKDDGRKKSVALSAKAIKHYEALSKCLENALKQG